MRSVDATKKTRREAEKVALQKAYLTLQAKVRWFRLEAVTMAERAEIYEKLAGKILFELEGVKA